MAARDADFVVEDVGALSHERAWECALQDKLGGESRDVCSAGCSHRSTHVHTQKKKTKRDGDRRGRASRLFPLSCFLSSAWLESRRSFTVLLHGCVAQPTVSLLHAAALASFSLSGGVCCTVPRTVPPTHRHGDSSLAFLSAGSLTLTRFAFLSLSWQR